VTAPEGVYGVLGNQIGEELGQVTGMRVLPAEDGASRVEVTFQAQGRLLDCDVNSMGTYVSRARPDGSMFGEGQGLDMANDGSMARWVGQGAGRLTPQGRATWRGAIYYSDSTGSLAPLNGTCMVYEFEIDETGKAEARLYEWK